MDISRFAWKYFKLPTSDRHQRLCSAGKPSSRKVTQIEGKSLTLEHESAGEKGAGEAFEGVADAVRRLGRRFLKYELIFNPAALIPLVEKYNLETIQRDGWVPEAFLDAGVTHQTLFSIYDNINIRQEAPWNDGAAKILIVTDMVWTVKAWIDAHMRSTVTRTERGRFPSDRILGSLDRIMASVGQGMSGKKLRERIIVVRDEIKRRF